MNELWMVVAETLSQELRGNSKATHRHVVSAGGSLSWDLDKEK